MNQVIQYKDEIVSHSVTCLIPSARAPPAAAVDAFDDLPLLQLGLGHPADAVGGEVGVPGLNAAQATEVLVALLLPLGDQVGVRYLVLQAVVVQFWKREKETLDTSYRFFAGLLGILATPPIGGLLLHLDCRRNNGDSNPRPCGCESEGASTVRATRSCFEYLK